MLPRKKSERAAIRDGFATSQLTNRTEWKRPVTEQISYPMSGIPNPTAMRLILETFSIFLRIQMAKN